MLGPAGGRTPADAVVLACGDAFWPAIGERVSQAAQMTVARVPAAPGKADVDPVLDRLGERRLVVCGGDAALGAVVLRLMRTSRLDTVVVGFVPSEASSPAAALWGLPDEAPRAMALALHGEPERVPLVRDDAGGVLVGRGLLRPVRGVIYCDDELVLRGQASAVEVSPHPGAGADTSHGGVTVRVRRTGLLGRRETEASGRAVQIGCLPTIPLRDGAPFDRPVDKWTWYRHTEDWRLVRGLL